MPVSESGSAQLPSPEKLITPSPVKRSYTAWIALLFALLSLGCSGYLYFQQATQAKSRSGSAPTNGQQFSAQLQQLKTQVQQNAHQAITTAAAIIQHPHPINTVVQQQLQQQQQIQQKQANNLSQQQLQMTQQAASVHMLQQQLQQQTQQLNQIVKSHHNLRRPWLIGQAEYLVQLAQLQLTYGQHVQTALQLLQSASQNLATVADAGLYGVRKQLHHDMQVLQHTAPLDEGAVVAQINALAQQVLSADLKIKQQFHAQGKSDLSVKSQHAAAQHSASQHAPTKGLRNYMTQGFSAMVAGFKNLVVIKRISSAVPQILSQQQILYIKQNIALKLTQAEWAVLQHDQQLYDMNLQRVNNMLQHLQKIQVTSTSRQLLSHLQSQLQLLQPQAVKLQLPKLYISIAALQALSLGEVQNLKPALPPALQEKQPKKKTAQHSKQEGFPSVISNASAGVNTSARVNVSPGVSEYTGIAANIPQQARQQARQQTPVAQRSGQQAQQPTSASKLMLQSKPVRIVTHIHALRPVDIVQAAAVQANATQGATHESIH